MFLIHQLTKDFQTLDTATKTLSIHFEDNFLTVSQVGVQKTNFL